MSPKSNLPSAIVAGHICLDIIPNLDFIPSGEFLHLLEPGHLINIGPAVFSTGGAVSNTGLALHVLGIPTRLMGKVGDDSFAQAVLGLVRRFGFGLADGMIVDDSASTSYSFIINAPGIDRIFLHHTGANDTFVPDDIPYDELKEAALFHFGYPPLMRQMFVNDGVNLVEIFRQAHATGITTSLDMAFPDPASPSGKAPWRRILTAALPYVDIFTPSIDEVLITLHPDLYRHFTVQAGASGFLNMVTPDLLSRLGNELISMGARLVLIKLGERGAYLRTGSVERLKDMGRACPPDLATWANVEFWAPCFQVNVVGTTGSGDSTIAGFLTALLRGQDPASALTMAVAVGACNVEASDALGGLRSWESTISRIDARWSQLPLELDTPGWAWSPHENLWRGPAVR
jgi:sugar/nucleoside kinase (ribokinase family)